jgi:hypothetical protein
MPEQWGDVQVLADRLLHDLSQKRVVAAQEELTPEDVVHEGDWCPIQGTDIDRKLRQIAERLSQG